jgi:hypothetical protein
MNDFQNMLDFDAFAAAEAITGKSYKDDEETKLLGMAMFMSHAKEQREELGLRDDTYYGIPFSTALAIYHDLGFVDGYDKTFVSPTNGVTESHMVLVHPDGILMNIVSFGESLNSATMFYNWELSNKDAHIHVSSGHYNSEALSENRYLWIGSHDARAGIRHTLDVLRANGTFLNKWKEMPFIWLLNYADERNDKDYEKVNQQVLNSMSPDVQEMVSFTTK